MKRALTLGGALARVLAWLLNRWPLLLTGAFFAFDEGPHLRVVYTYQGPREYPRYISCTYLGSRGLVPGYVPGCPLIVWIDAKGGE